MNGGGAVPVAFACGPVAVTRVLAAGAFALAAAVVTSIVLPIRIVAVVVAVAFACGALDRIELVDATAALVACAAGALTAMFVVAAAPAVAAAGLTSMSTVGGGGPPKLSTVADVALALPVVTAETLACTWVRSHAKDREYRVVQVSPSVDHSQ
jgi:hypothetical protein